MLSNAKKITWDIFYLQRYLARIYSHCLFVAFFFVHQSHSPLCSFFTNKKSTKNTMKTVPTYKFAVTKSAHSVNLCDAFIL